MKKLTVNALILSACLTALPVLGVADNCCVGMQDCWCGPTATAVQAGTTAKVTDANGQTFEVFILDGSAVPNVDTTKYVVKKLQIAGSAQDVTTAASAKTSSIVYYGVARADGKKLTKADLKELVDLTSAAKKSS